MNTNRILFYLLLVLLPTQLTKYFFPEFAFVYGIRVDYLAPVIYATDLIIIALIVFWLFEKVAAGRWPANGWASLRRATTLVFGLLCLGIINIFFAINPIIALFKWLRILEVAFLVFYIVKTKLNIRFAVYNLLFAGFYSCLLAWFQFIEQSSINGIFWWLGERTFTLTTPGIARLTFNNELFLRPYATFPHPNVLAGFLVCLLPFMFLARNFTKYTKLLFIPTLVLFLATIAVTFSQSAWVLGIITTIIFILKERGVKFTKSLAIAGVICTLAIFIFSYQFTETESIERRVALGKNSLSLIQQYIWTGVGLNNFIVANARHISISSYQDLQPVHSIYLLYVAETGIIGTLLFVLVIFFTYKKVQVNKNSFYFIWSFLMLLLLGLFDHYLLTIHQTLLLFGILTGFIFTSNRVIK